MADSSSPPGPPAASKRFHVALSFPGEHRGFVKEVAEHLAGELGRKKVLYDQFYEAEFARPDLDIYLQRLYRHESDLVVLFVCAEYDKKEWCALEWAAVRDLIKARETASVMPLRFDNTEIPGLFSTAGYVSLPGKSPEQVAQLILERWRFNQGHPPAPRPATATTSRPPAAPTGPNPFDPFHPAVPPRFVGRRAELRRLEASLTDRNGVSIVGDPRIGKTSLLRTWEQKAKALGREVVFLDGQGPEGAAVAAFVGAVVGRPVAESPDGAADALAAWAKRQPVGLEPVLLVDGFDSLVTRFDRRFFERLREMLDYLVLAIATHRPVDLLYKEIRHTSPFEGRLKVIYLGLLEGEAADQVLARNPELGASDREEIHEWAGRHPYFLELFAHCWAESKRFGESGSDALENALNTAFPRLRDLRDRSSDGEQEALRQACQGRPSALLSLRRRGLVNEGGLPFGRVLLEWMEQEG